MSPANTKQFRMFPARPLPEARAIIEGQDLQVGEERKNTVIRL